MAKRSNDMPASGIEQIKYGSGVIGKTAPLIGGLILLAVVAMGLLRSDPWLVTGIFAVTVAVVVGYFLHAFHYAKHNPASALLEGTHLIRYKELELAASDPKIIDHSPSGSQNTSPPKSIVYSGGDSDG